MNTLLLVFQGWLLGLATAALYVSTKEYYFDED